VEQVALGLLEVMEDFDVSQTYFVIRFGCEIRDLSRQSEHLTRMPLCLKDTAQDITGKIIGHGDFRDVPSPSHYHFR